MEITEAKLFEDIIDACDLLGADETLDIADFGKNGDLILHIRKDSDYEGDDSFNLVTIQTEQDGIIVDDTEDTYVTDGTLWEELDRIFHYECFETL